VTTVAKAAASFNFAFKRTVKLVETGQALIGQRATFVF